MKKMMLVVVAAVVSGCSTAAPRLVKRPAWDFKLPPDAEITVKTEGRTLLTISPDGTRWVWISPAEDVVKEMLSSYFRLMATAAAQEKALVEALKAPEKKAAAPSAPAAAPKRKK